MPMQCVNLWTLGKMGILLNAQGMGLDRMSAKPYSVAIRSAQEFSIYNRVPVLIMDSHERNA